MATYAGGKGETVENAVVIVNAANHQDGVRAEYDYIARHYGKAQIDWQLRGQGLIYHDNKPYDQMDFVLNDGTEKTLYFDISDFFGKGLDELMTQEQRPKSPLERFMDNLKRLFGMR